jgi:predicted transcriptional regulator
MDEHFDLENRRRIFQHITENPGTHLRRISRDMDMTIGTLRHHLEYLEKHDIVSSMMENNLKVYFNAKNNGSEHRNVAPLLQQKRFRDLLLYVLVHPGVTPTEMAENLELKSSTLSKYNAILEKRGLVRYEKEGRNKRFYLVGEDMILRLLLTYRKSFWDSFVDNVLEIYFEQ